MCRSNNPLAAALLVTIMVATIAFLLGTLPPASTVEAATWGF